MPTIIDDFTLTVALWIAVVAAALVVTASIVALVRQTLAGTLVFIAIVGFATWGVYALSATLRDAERRALESRLDTLEAATWATGSPLGCLGTVSGDAVDAACEHVLFANAGTVAAAASFTNARLALLRDASAFARGREASFESRFGGLRAVLEQDRHGLVAYVLKQRYGCTADACELTRLLHDPAKVRANLREGTFARKLAEHHPSWTAPEPVPPPPVAEGGVKHTPLPSTFILPSSDSIPPISIMDPEPTITGTTPAPSGPAAAAPPSSSPPAARAPRTANPNGGTRPPAPLQLGPSDRP
jgi:hypothetical protein